MKFYESCKCWKQKVSEKAKTLKPFWLLGTSTATESFPGFRWLVGRFPTRRKNFCAYLKPGLFLRFSPLPRCFRMNGGIFWCFNLTKSFPTIACSAYSSGLTAFSTAWDCALFSFPRMLTFWGRLHQKMSKQHKSFLP